MAIGEEQSYGLEGLKARGWKGRVRMMQGGMREKVGAATLRPEEGRESTPSSNVDGGDVGERGSGSGRCREEEKNAEEVEGTTTATALKLSGRG
jgi:hypothetical protein